MQGHAHLAQGERYHIELMHRERVSIQRIAAGMNRSLATVSGELAHNAGQRGYWHKQAQGKARERLKSKPKCVGMTLRVDAFVEVRLAERAGIQGRSAGA